MEETAAGTNSPPGMPPSASWKRHIQVYVVVFVVLINLLRFIFPYVRKIVHFFQLTREKKEILNSLNNKSDTIEDISEPNSGDLKMVENRKNLKHINLQHRKKFSAPTYELNLSLIAQREKESQAPSTNARKPAASLPERERASRPRQNQVRPIDIVPQFQRYDQLPLPLETYQERIQQENHHQFVEQSQNNDSVLRTLQDIEYEECLEKDLAKQLEEEELAKRKEELKERFNKEPAEVGFLSLFCSAIISFLVVGRSCDFMLPL
jgi:hypothetical protein